MKQIIDDAFIAIAVSFNPLVILGIISAILMLADITIRKVRWKDVKNNFLKWRSRMKKAN